MRKVWALSAYLILGLATVALGAEALRFPAPVADRGRQILSALYDLDYDRADELARQLTREAPDEPMTHVLVARTIWSRQLNTERVLSIDRFSRSDFVSNPHQTGVTVSAEVEKRFRDACARAKETARKRISKDSKDYAARYALGAAYQVSASFEYSIKRKWWQAYRQGENFVQIHRSLLQVTDHPDLHFANGLTYYLAASIPPAIKPFAVVFGFRGDKEKGKRELELSARDGVFVAEDARTMLALFYARDKEHAKAAVQLNELLARHPRNYLAHLELGGLALARQRPDEALTIYQQILNKVERNSDGYGVLDRAMVYTRLGIANRGKGDFPAAQGWFQKALNAQAGAAQSKTIARLELGKTYDLMGRRDDAVGMYRQLLNEADFAGTRDEAKDLIEKPYEMPKRLEPGA